MSVVSGIIFLLSGCKTAKLSDAEEAYGRGEYFEAQKLYRKIYNDLSKKEERPLKGEIAFKLGLCYDKLNMGARATTAFQNAIRYQYPDSSVYFYLGKALQREGKYQSAITAYEDYLDYKPGSRLAIEGIKGCKTGLGMEGLPQTRYIVKNAKLFNSSRSDYSPMFAGKDFDILYFTSNNEKVTGENKSDITGLKFGDIYFSRKNEYGQWRRPEILEGEVNTEGDEGIVSFSPDGLTMYFTKSVKSDNSNTTVEIFTSQRTDASWSDPEKFVITTDSLAATGHPAVSADGKYLYFTGDIPGGYGGLDIWRIDIKDSKGSLHNMGPQINTSGNEMFPYSRNDSTLYFSSDGHPGLGGLDIFRAVLNSTGDYWSVENLGSPINSSGDDFGITFGEGDSGFFSSNRGDVRGYDHIYSFELPDIHISISGSVVDRDDEPVAGAIIRIVGDDGSNQREISRDDGSFRFKLGRGVKYVMKAGAEGYLNVKQEFESDSSEEDAEYGIDFVLTAINKPQVLENIFYDFDKATLRAESKTSLDELVKIMNENPNITIEMGSHTDRKGSDEYNLNLSERRAKSVVDYLINNGIDADRLVPKGYGETEPKTVTKRIHKDYPQFEEGTILTEDFILTLSPEDQEAADQINRRTEFKVLSIDYGLF